MQNNFAEKTEPERPRSQKEKAAMMLDPISILKKKEEYGRAELAKDTPVIMLTSPHAIYCASVSTSRAHQKIISLVNGLSIPIILCGRGNPSDLMVFKNEILKAITNYEQAVSRQDIAGRLIAATAATILREHFLEGPKALSVQIALMDLQDPGDPICAISFTGEQFVGKNFLLKDAEIILLPETSMPQTLDEMKAYAKSAGIPAEGQQEDALQGFAITLVRAGDASPANTQNANSPAEQQANPGINLK